MIDPTTIATLIADADPPDYDLATALVYNQVLCAKPTGVILEITGEKDGAEWHWLCTTATGFAYICGGCDYTGWDCRSHAEGFDTATFDEALSLVPQVERATFVEMITAGEQSRVNKGSFYGG